VEDAPAPSDYIQEQFFVRVHVNPSQLRLPQIYSSRR
jgi:hypothetical protein